MIKIKRIYDSPSKNDGYRILVDRLWPRGISKESAKIDLWMKEIAPSTELRKWFNHDPQKWNEFQKRYKKELESKKELLIQLKAYMRKYSPITLLYCARDTEHNEAVMLVAMLSK